MRHFTPSNLFFVRENGFLTGQGSSVCLSNSMVLSLRAPSSYTSVLLVGVFNAIFKGAVFFKGAVHTQGCSACLRVELVLHLETLDAFEACIRRGI
jgi:hypothetical protein